eukprot:15342448-Ditylum_brightwellii.AAC.1
MFKSYTTKLDPDDPWGSILSTVMFALWPTIHMTHKTTHMQLIFGKDAMLNGNVKWKLHKYHINNKVMIKNNQKLKYRTNTYSRPYQITKVHDNVTVCVKYGKVTDIYNIQNIMQYEK